MMGETLWMDGSGVKTSRRRGWQFWLALPALVGLFVVIFGAAVPEAHGQAATNTPTATATPVQRPGGRFEENDPALLYSGTWTAVTDSRASNGALRRSNTEGASVQFTFPGPNVRWITTRGPDRGIARIFVNDQDRGTVDLYAPAEQFGQELSWGGLDDQRNHTVRIVVTGQRNGASAGTNVDVDSFVVVGAVVAEPIRFESTDPAVVFSGQWATLSESRASGNAFHRSATAGAAAQFTFTGNSVTLLSATGPNRGIARVLIDNQLQATLDLYSAEERFQQPYQFTGLSDGTHQIRVEVSGTHSGPSAAANVDVDAFVVFGAPTTPVPTPTLMPTPTATATPVQTPVATPTVTPAPTAVPPQAPRDSRYFFETQFRVDHAPFWDYFQSRGGVDAFGFPVSRTFLLLGCTTQIFQRQLMQQCGAGTPVRTMNLLDPELMPYNQINFSVFPAHDPQVASRAPAPGTPNYGQAVLDYIRSVAPDNFQGLPVRFFTTFVNTVPGSDPASNPDFAALVNLEIWGFPTSPPQFDPNNRNFVYQRFQRGIMHFDAQSGATRGILLADYMKGIMIGRTGPNLPPDLAAQAQGSRFFRQYCPGNPEWACRAAEVFGTDLTFAFEPQ
jgi:hypothetical protein